MLAICHEPRFASLPPSQIVPMLADEKRYIASESTFYRVLRRADETTVDMEGDRPQTDVVMGHNPAEVADGRALVLSVSDRRYVQPQNRGL